MKLELKQVRILKNCSQDGLCFQAAAYVNGVKAFEVCNAGQGGPNQYNVLNAGLYEAAQAYALTLPPIHCFGRELAMHLELLVGELLDDQLRARELKRLLKKIVFISGGKVMTCNVAYSEALRGQLIARHPEAIILNELSFEAALAEFKKVS